MMEKPDIPGVGKYTKPPFRCGRVSVSNCQELEIKSHIDPFHPSRRCKMKWVEDVLDPEDVV